MPKHYIQQCWIWIHGNWSWSTAVEIAVCLKEQHNILGHALLSNLESEEKIDISLVSVCLA